MSVWHWLADAVLITHFALALFIVLAVPVIITGNIRGWRWVNGPWFRGAHLVAIAVVVLESWTDVTCPLTTLEAWLRTQAGQYVTEEAFVVFWVRRILFYEGPAWAFTAAYTAFGILVAVIWIFFPVQWPNKTRN